MFRPVKCPPKCIYAAGAKADGICSIPEHCCYILKTGHSRGCDPGPGCIRYKQGKRIRNELGISRKRSPRPSSWDERAGYKMWLAGKTDREIADALGIRRDTVGNTRRRKWMKGKNMRSLCNTPENWTPDSE